MPKPHYDFFAPTSYIPTNWYLHECLLWIAIKKVPRGSECYETNIEDLYIDRLREFGPQLSQSNLVHLDKNYTDELGISPSPMYGDYENVCPKDIEEKIGFIKFNRDRSPASSHRHYDAQLEEAEDFLYQRDQWLIEQSSALDVSKTKLFMALNDGSLSATGMKIPGRSMESACRHLSKEKSYLRKLERVPIPTSFWTLNAVNWDDSAIQSEVNIYCGVAVNQNDLFEAFPPIYAEPVAGGIVDGFFMRDNSAANTTSPSSTSQRKSGRPSYNWDAFHLEVTRRILSNDLPEKQMAAAFDFQAWFLNMDGSQVGTSTISEKLKPYYDAFVKRKSRK